MKVGIKERFNQKLTENVFDKFKSPTPPTNNEFEEIILQSKTAIQMTHQYYNMVNQLESRLKSLHEINVISPVGENHPSKMNFVFMPNALEIKYPACGLFFKKYRFNIDQLSEDRISQILSSIEPILQKKLKLQNKLNTYYEFTYAENRNKIANSVMLQHQQNKVDIPNPVPTTVQIEEYGYPNPYYDKKAHNPYAGNAANFKWVTAPLKEAYDSLLFYATLTSMPIPNLLYTNGFNRTPNDDSTGTEFFRWYLTNEDRSIAWGCLKNISAGTAFVQQLYIKDVYGPLRTAVTDVPYVIKKTLREDSRLG